MKKRNFTEKHFKTSDDIELYYKKWDAAIDNPDNKKNRTTISRWSGTKHLLKITIIALILQMIFVFILFVKI